MENRVSEGRDGISASFSKILSSFSLLKSEGKLVGDFFAYHLCGSLAVRVRVSMAK